MKKNYEKRIGLNTIYLAIKRRFGVILYLLVCSALVGVIYVTSFATKEYKVSAVFTGTAYITTQDFSELKADVSSDVAIDTTVANLNEKGLRHANGDLISSSDIKGKLTYSDLPGNTYDFKFQLSGTDKSVLKQILNELSNVSIDIVNNYFTSKYTYKTFSVSQSTSDPIKISKEYNYMLFIMVVGGCLGLILATTKELVSDTVYDKYEFEYYNSDVYEILFVNKKGAKRNESIK